jgi:hypothetical protein
MTITPFEAYQKEIKSSCNTAGELLREAIANVNEQLGAGAAERHPQIVAALVQASALGMIQMPDLKDLDISNLAGAIERLGYEIRNAIIEKGDK